jgi:hypothetical protein
VKIIVGFFLALPRHCSDCGGVMGSFEEWEEVGVKRGWVE